MKQAMAILSGVVAALFAIHLGLGYQAAYELGYGAITVMSASIAGTFFWLYRERTTPLAIGMAFSWAGTASIMGWWWSFNVLGHPEIMVANETLLVFLAVHSAGAILHFGVMQRSMGFHRGVFAVPVGIACAASALIYLLV